MSQQTIIPPTSSDWPRPPYGSVWARFVAWCIDRTIIDFSLLIFLLLLVFLTPLGTFFAFPVLVATGGFLSLSISGAWLFVDWVYFASFESSLSGATPGKRFMGLRVTDIGGRQLTFWRASLRYGGKILSYLPMMLGFALALVTEKKQALHDLIAETVVLKVK